MKAFSRDLGSQRPISAIRNQSSGDFLHLRSKLFSNIPFQSIPLLHCAVPKILAVPSFEKPLQIKRALGANKLKKYSYVVCHAEYPEDPVRNFAGKNSIL